MISFWFKLLENKYTYCNANVHTYNTSSRKCVMKAACPTRRFHKR